MLLKKLIKKSEELKKKVAQAKLKKLKIVHCHGVFDLFHAGHVSYLQEAKKYGDILLVTLTEDKFVKKGPGRPFFKSIDRANVISSLSCVDYVYINHAYDAVNLIKLIKPDFYIKGPDYKKNTEDITNKIKDEKLITKKYGGKIAFTSQETFSSSKIINKSDLVFNFAQRKYLKKLGKKNLDKYLDSILSKISKKKILLVGEAIIDNYNFCEGLGKSGKESVLIVRDLYENKYIGGVLSMANYLAEFCKEVQIISYLGKKKEYLNFINKNLNKKVKFDYIIKKDSSTIIKKRFYDLRDRKKLFGSYLVNDTALDEVSEKILLKKITKSKSNKNAIIVADFGHGLISIKTARFISKQKNFFGLNAQVNSSTVGYNNISKYLNPKCVVINATELRQELKERDGDLNILARKLKRIIKAKYLVVTMGRAGAMMLDENDKTIICPAFAFDIVDKIGAGDTLFAYLNLFLLAGCDKELSLFIASIAAAENTGTYANNNILSKINLKKSIHYLLK